MDEKKQIRNDLPTHKTFFYDVRALTRYVYFDGWHATLTFMMEGHESEPDTS